MKKLLLGIPLVLLLLALTVGCAGQGISLKNISSDGPANFRLLLSDEANAIGDFKSLEVTVSRIGLLQSGDAGKWLEITLEEPATLDLTTLTGANASEVWNGSIPAGDYSKAFIYVDKVIGTLNDKAGTIVEIKVPSGKLQISEPFSVAPPVNPGASISPTDPTPATATVAAEQAPDLVEFVFDITVVKAGNSGQYIIKPQITDSGADKEYTEVAREQNNEGPNKDGTAKFKGTIVSIDSGNDLWKVKVGDETLDVNVAEADIDGSISAAGLLVKIEGVRTDTNVAASEVEVKKAEAKSTKNVQK